MENNLKDKAVNIHGKKYVLVKDRVAEFNKQHENGCIKTKLVKWKNGKIIFQAKAIPNIEEPDRFFTGYAQETVGDGKINQEAALENAETSAVGRALAFMGIGIIESIASANEVRKASNSSSKQNNTQNYTNTQQSQQDNSNDNYILCSQCEQNKHKPTYDMCYDCHQRGK